MKILPTLYKKTNTGAIQFWTIQVGPQIGQMNDKEYAPEWGLIVITYGQVGTDSPQTTNETITEGKNLGKKNATTALQQAQSEAQSKWEKQKKKGYVETPEAAAAGEIDDIIEGGLFPMLAQAFSKHSHKVVYPAFAQPKLDGIRCIAIIEDGVCTLWSRTRKQIRSMAHIQEVLQRAFPKGSFKLDGELYNHQLKADFERIASVVRKDEPNQPGADLAQYHVYDAVVEGTNEQRLVYLAGLYREHIAPAVGDTGKVQLVPTRIVRTEEQVEELMELFRNDGYEGIMVRNAAGVYTQNKRSYDLLKLKGDIGDEWDEEEFQVVGVNEGTGKLAGHAATLTCVDSKGAEFKPKMMGENPRLKEIWDNPSLAIGKKATVLYFGLTNKNKVPRFPRAKTIRDYE